jgi:heterodisulfide reductase subunit A-like polyferredoxin
MHGILRPVPGRAQDIWLTDALCGCTFDIVHLDNRVLQVRAARARACAACFVSCPTGSVWGSG